MTVDRQDNDTTTKNIKLRRSVFAQLVSLRTCDGRCIKKIRRVAIARIATVKLFKRTIFYLDSQPKLSSFQQQLTLNSKQTRQQQKLLSYGCTVQFSGCIGSITGKMYGNTTTDHQLEPVITHKYLGHDVMIAIDKQTCNFQRRTDMT